MIINEMEEVREMRKAETILEIIRERGRMDISEALTSAEVARQYNVSERTVERWVEKGLEAEKATNEQLLSLLAADRLKGWPPKGVWLISRAGLGRIAIIRKPVGYPKGKPRRSSDQSS